MGNWLSLQQCPQGDNTGNTGSHNTMGPYNTTGSQNIMGSNNTIHYHHEDRAPSANREKILQQIYPPGSGYESHRNRVSKPVQGTCTWVTGHAKYKEWLENKTSGLLWLSADPGCGKSVIAALLVGHLETQKNVTVCYFFFKDDNEEQRSVVFALRAILHQLFIQKPNLCSYAEEVFKAKGSRFVEEMDILWNIFVKAVAEGGCGDVICVVDALDECEEVTITPFIRYLIGLRGSQPSGIPLKFLVTSRPYHRIEIELGSPSTTIRLKGEEEVDAVTADVSRVIDEGIKKLELYWGRAGGLEYLRNLLMSSADRTFLWVSLVLEILKASQDDAPEEFTNIVTTAPRDLAQFYTKILNKSVDPVKARRILNIVVAAARPLTLREINIAFRIRKDHRTIKDLGEISPRFENTLKNLCGLFVRVIGGKVYLVHQTAREFLAKGSSPGEGNWQYTLGSSDSNFIMADICIAYLMLEDFEKAPLPEGTNSSDVSEEYGLLDYAANHWPSHFRDSQEHQMGLFEFTRAICKRGSNRFLNWLKMFWWFNVRDARFPFPHDFTHLMIASWLGQEGVVKRILEEGEDLDARSEDYGTTLNVAALREDNNIIEMLVKGNIVANLDGKDYNILNTKISELELLERRREERLLRLFLYEERERYDRKEERELMILRFLKPFCIQDHLLSYPTGTEQDPLAPGYESGTV